MKEWVDRWPSPIVARSQIKDFTGGAISPHYLANLDSDGLGPPRYRIGRKIVYPVKDLIAWLESRSTLPSKGKQRQAR